MTQIEIPAVGNLVTFMHPTLGIDHPGEVIEIEDKTWPDLGGTDRRHVGLWVADRITRRSVRISLAEVVSDLGPLRL